MKKLVVLSLSLLAVASVFAGGKTNTGPRAAAGGGGSKKYSSLPFVTDGKTTFSVFVGGLTFNITSYDAKDNIYTKLITDNTGINFKFIAVSNVDMDQRLNVLLSSGVMFLTY
jgi:ABC-type glycerol-3-phosphate transport system substrate-binding protein